ncbi:MAG: hypothetical protein A2452_10585 [Candidatus Firestonebacteria bacterium RIFOXYC2_FULL_39_67]|nr:MAG: hypothetical protein A2452_10585 [Candidatus Firestonebacteria bacterium RIFOXYC2_FULL_39_67]
MKRSLTVEITKPVLYKYAEDYLSSIMAKFLGEKRTDIIVLFRDFYPAAFRVVSFAIYKLINDNYTVIKTNNGYAEELSFPVIYDQAGSNKISPYCANYFLKDKNGNKMAVRMKLSKDDFVKSYFHVYLPASKLDLGKKFFADLENTIMSLTDLRLNGAGEFLESVQELADKDIILPEEIKRSIKSNVVGTIERYRQYANTNELNEFNVIKRGVLLFGDPGTGKSLTIRWLMSTIKCCNFIVATGKHLKRSDDVAEVFSLARSIRPCIVVLEDIDLYGLSRDGGYFNGGILNEFLNQLDGASNLNGVVTIATANKLEVLDKALTKRPGRFDVIIHYENPSVPERINLLNLNLSKTDTGKSVDINHIADITDGFSPAQIVEVVKRGYIISREREGNTIQQYDLVFAVNQLKSPAKEIGFKTPKGKAE